MLWCWSISGQRQIKVCRLKYFKKLMNHDIKWYDKININQTKIQSMYDTPSLILLSSGPGNGIIVHRASFVYNYIKENIIKSI